MAKHLIDLDEGALAAARAVLGTATMRDTVNQALRAVADGSTRQLAESLASLGAVTEQPVQWVVPAGSID